MYAFPVDEIDFRQCMHFKGRLRVILNATCIPKSRARLVNQNSWPLLTLSIITNVPAGYSSDGHSGA